MHRDLIRGSTSRCPPSYRKFQQIGEANSVTAAKWASPGLEILWELYQGFFLGCMQSITICSISFLPPRNLQSVHQAPRRTCLCLYQALCDEQKIWSVDYGTSWRSIADISRGREGLWDIGQCYSQGQTWYIVIIVLIRILLQVCQSWTLSPSLWWDCFFQTSLRNIDKWLLQLENYKILQLNAST